MPKSRANRNRSGGKTKKHLKKHLKDACCPATMHWLNKWFEEMFEKLGWMVLAHKKGYKDKVVSYMKSLHRLRKALHQKMAKVHDIDRKNDLAILAHNLNTLIAHAERDFGHEMRGGDCVTDNNGNCIPIGSQAGGQSWAPPPPPDPTNLLGSIFGN